MDFSDHSAAAAAAAAARTTDDIGMDNLLIVHKFDSGRKSYPHSDVDSSLAGR